MLRREFVVDNRDGSGCNVAGYHMKTNSISEGSMRIGQKYHKESITFNRGTLIDQDSVKAAPRGIVNDNGNGDHSRENLL